MVLILSIEFSRIFKEFTYYVIYSSEYFYFPDFFPEISLIAITTFKLHRSFNFTDISVVLTGSVYSYSRALLQEKCEKSRKVKIGLK